MEIRKSQLAKLTEKYESIQKSETCELAQSRSSISKREISSKTNNSIKQYGEGSLSVQPKDNTPRQEGEEINRLAKTWCELLLSQMQETQNIQILRSDFEAKSNENIVSSLIS